MRPDPKHVLLSRAHFPFPILLLLLLALVAAACGDGAETVADTAADTVRDRVAPAETFVRKELVADLQELGEWGETGRDGALVLRTEALAAGAAGGDIALDVAGCLAAKGPETPPPLGPATFRLRLGDRIVFEKELETRRPRICFEELVELGEMPTDPAIIRWSAQTAGPQDVVLRWSRIALVRTHPTQRLSRDTGPSLLFLMVDTLRADHCGLYGYERDTTPFLDAFSRDALVFERALSPSSWTLPATASILTGLTPPRHGVTGSERLPERFVTLAEEMQRAGLTTVALSANPIVDARFGFDQGFETFEHLPWRPAEDVVDRFLAWLGDNRDHRFFAYLHFLDPHSPYEVPEGAERPFTDPDYDGPFRDMGLWDEVFRAKNWNLGEAPAEPSREDLEFLVAAYDEEIRYWDGQVQRLVGRLESLGVLDQTVVIVTSDHGEEFAEHGMYQHGHQLFDESIRVPLLLRGPRWVEPGRRSDPVDVRRLHPTLAHLARGQEPAGRDLRRRVPDATALSHVAVSRDPTSTEIGVERWALHRGRWTYLMDVSPANDPENGPENYEEAVGRLFDLENDPRQRRDVAPRETEVAASLRRALEEQMGGPAEEGEEGKVDPELVEELRALGYLAPEEPPGDDGSRR